MDRIPIRVFKNNIARGIAYPNKPMHIEASIWNADWAGAVDWSQAPFIVKFEDFGFLGCTSNAGCRSTPNYKDLGPAQRLKMQRYRKLYMTYDYCSKPSTWKPECAFNV